jgi:hypothetical protein
VASRGYRSLADAGLTVGAIGGTVRARDLPFRFDEWDGKHPVFEPFDDPQHGDLRRLAFTACTRIEPDADAKVLARFRGGPPALIEKSLERGKVLWFASTCDREWSDWVRSRLYVPIVHQMLGYLAGLTGGGPVREMLVDSAGSAGNEPTPGVFTQDDYVAVVNVSPRESETDRCTPEDFVKRFPMRLHETPDAGALSPLVSAASPNADVRDDEIWHWFAFTLVGALLLEGFLANRTAA